MSNKTIADVIQRARNNPLALVSGVIDSIDALGEMKFNVVDASNPFTQLLEVSALCLQSSVDEQRAITRALYPSLSEDYSDIYRHLSDRDKVDINAKPSRTILTVAISREEVLTRAVPIGNSSISKLTIPSHTRFKVNGIEFGIHYPIDIRVLNNGSIRAVWNNDVMSSPIPLTENILDTDIRRINTEEGGVDYLLIDIPVEQFAMESRTGTIQASGFKQLYNYTDSFYFARVFMSNGNKWEEIPTTYSNTAFDVGTVTAILEVRDGAVTVSIPQVYFTRGIVGKTIRVDIYSTRGDLKLSLAGLNSDAFSLEWRDLDNIENGEYTTPLYAITSVAIRGSESTTGGRGALGVDKLRERVVSGSISGDTPFDLVTEVRDLGYDITRLYDNATSRVYSLSRHLNEVTSTNFSTVGVLTDKFRFRFDELVDSAASVNKHLESMTILPSTLYVSTDNGLKAVAPPELMNPDQYTADEVINVLNTLKPVFSPFHYVLENRNEFFNKRCYLMDQPEITARNFVDANGTYPYDISLSIAQIEYRTDGYRVLVKVKSGDAIKALHDSQVNVQLAFTPINSTRRVYLNGELSTAYVDNERVYFFDFTTRYEITDEDHIKVSGFQVSQTDRSDYLLGLTHTFDLLFTVNGVTLIGDVGNLDSLSGADLLPPDSVVLTHETVEITLGSRLEPLEGRTLTYYNEAKYEEYEEDVPLLRERPKYRDDESGYIDVTVDGNALVYDKIADVGDPVLDSAGNPRFLHRAGDLKLVNDKPVLIEEGYVERAVDLVTFNAMFQYATESTARSAVTDKAGELLGHVNDGLRQVAKLIPPRTGIQFTPKSNAGRVAINESNGVEYTVDAGLSFQVDLYMTENAYKDIASHDLVKAQVREVIIERVKDEILSVLSIEQSIKEAIGSELVTCNVGAITDENLQVAALQDNDRSFSIAPIMTMLSDGRITPKDDININISSVRRTTSL